VPQSIIKPIDLNLVAIAEGDYVTIPLDTAEDEAGAVPPEQFDRYLSELEAKMRAAAQRFDFKQAAAFRDRIKELKSKALIEITADPSMT
jgi:excinuclease ABC subunit B